MKMDHEQQMAQAEEVLGDSINEVGFAKGLFFGEYLNHKLLPYPDLDRDPRADKMVEDLRQFCREHVDAAAIDRTAEIPQSVIDGLGKLGVLVAIETTGNEHAANAFGRQVAMHVAATNPMALTAEQIDPAAVEREKAIFSDQARQSGKPEAIIEKMVEGRLRKFYEEVVLLKQAFVLNPDITVEKALKDAEKEIGAPAKISAYLRFALGEGIEKEETDFAAEVAAAVKK